MKKRDILLAASLLLGFGLNANAQEAPESQMFFFGFEDGLTSFKDSTHPSDSIKQINYYADDPTTSGDWTIVYTKDSLMYLLNGISPANRGGALDDVSIITEAPEEEGGKSAHQAEFEDMGAQGGTQYLKWATAGSFSTESGDLCADYSANLFIRGLKIEDQTSYRLVFYLKSATATGNVQAGIFRGQYNSEKPLSMNGASGNEFLLELTEFKKDEWERHTLMSYYQNDSVANNHMYKAGYWWNDSWKVTTKNEADEEVTYNKIEQFDTYFVRFAFRSPGSTFYIDDIALYKSTIGGAECNADLIRVDFGYQTNLAALAKADPNGAIKLPGDYFSVTGIDPDQGEDPIEIKVLSAEYHTDGYLYMWLDDVCSYYSDIKVNFTNPVDNPKLTLKYTGDFYPNSLDTAWVNAGKIVPDFQNEFVLPNPDVFATSLEFVAPSVKSTTPETGSFNLDPEIKEIKVVFSKEVYVNIAAGVNTEGVLAKLVAGGYSEYWVPTEYDDETYTVTFTRQGTAALKGDYDFTIMNMRAGQEASYEKGPDYTMSLSFGPADVAPEVLNEINFMNCPNSDYQSTEIAGFSTNESCVMKVADFQGEYTKALMFGLYGVNVPNGAPILNAELEFDKADTYNIYWGTSGCKKNSWNDGCVMLVDLLDAEGKVLASYDDGETQNRPDEGGMVASYDHNGFKVAIPAAGTYTLRFKLPNENSWSGGHQGGRVLYYIRIMNNFSSAYTYIAKFKDAYEAAQAKAATAAETPSKYIGEYYDNFLALLKFYSDFADTKPTRYNAVVDSLNAATKGMQARMDLVDDLYKSIETAKEKGANNLEKYGATEASKALYAKFDEFAALDATKLSDDSIKAVKKIFDDAAAALDNRVKITEAYEKECTDNLNAINDEKALKTFVEYAEMVKAYNENNNVDLIAATDKEITDATAAMLAGRKSYNFKVTEVAAKTMQLKALAELAESVEANFGDAAEDIAARTASTLDDDQELCNIYKQAIKAAIYGKIASGELDPSTDNLELYPFITNYALYSVAEMGAQLEKYHYDYGNVDRWRLKNKTFVDEVFPGWTVSGVFGSAHVGSEGRSWENDEPIFDAGLSCDWTSGATVSGTISGLPVGIYSIGADVKHGVDNCTFKVTVPEGMDSTMTMAKETGVLTMDEVLLPAGEAAIKYTIGSGSGWDYIYGFTAIMTGVDENFQYEVAAAEAQAAFEELYTIVPTTKENAAAKYFNLNGMEVKNPNGIVIKVVDGKAQKVLK